MSLAYCTYRPKGFTFQRLARHGDRVLLLVCDSCVESHSYDRGLKLSTTDDSRQKLMLTRCVHWLRWVPRVGSPLIMKLKDRKAKPILEKTSMASATWFLTRWTCHSCFCLQPTMPGRSWGFALLFLVQCGNFRYVSDTFSDHVF